MAKKVALINMKGGVGKSTLSVNLAWYLALKRKWSKRVLLVDLDPQFNSTQYTIGVEAFETLLRDGHPTSWDIFEQKTQIPGRKMAPLVPSAVVLNHRASRAGGVLDLIPSRLELAFSLKNPAGKERLLGDFIKKLEKNYDLIIFDCPPTESMLTMAAYYSCDSILVPVKPEYLSSIGLPLLVNSMQEFRNEYKKQLDILGILFNHSSNYIPEEAESKKSVRAVAKKNNWPVFKNEVPYSRSFPKGAREGRPLFLTSYVHYYQEQRFANVAEEFATRVGL